MHSPGAAPDSQHHRKRLSLGLSLGVTILVITVLLALAVNWLLRPDPPYQSRRMPSGDRLDLLGWTLGSKHEFLLGVRWQKLLWPLLPSSQRDKLTTVTQMYRNAAPPDTLVLWTSRVSSNGEFLQGRRTTVDEHGCEMTAEDLSNYGYCGSGAVLAEPWAIDTFPRRGPNVRIRHYLPGDGDRGIPSVEFTIPNPDPGPHPQWQPASLPTSETWEDLTFTLKGLYTRLPERGAKGPLSDGQLPWTSAAFLITRGGRTAEGWHACALTIFDSTGNVWRDRRHTYDMSGDEVRFDVPLGLCTRETYGLRVEFTHEREFDRAELLRLPRIAVPSQGNIVSVGRTFKQYGATITLKEVIGPNTRIPDWGDELYPDPIVALTVGPEEVSRRRLKRYRDPIAMAEWGQELSDPGMSSTVGEYWFRIRERPIPRQLDLTLAVRKSYFVEFLARPIAPASSTAQ